MNILISINRMDKKPVFRQVMDRIMELADSNALKPGDRLPSTRVLADNLGVNRSTVYKAYQELWSLGYLDSNPGSYSCIRKRARAVYPPSASSVDAAGFALKTNEASRSLAVSYAEDKRLQEYASRPGIIDLMPLAPDSRLFPVETFRKCMNHVLKHEGARLLNYGDPLGYKPLRDYVSARMLRHGISAGPEEIMITSGAQNGLDLLVKLLAGSQSNIIIENPTYARAIDIFRLNNISLRPLPINQNGLDLGDLEKSLGRDKPAFIYTIPNFHNPTGATTSQAHRESLINICDRYKTLLVEDGFEEEMKYFGQAVLPIKSMDQGGTVMYLGTFSKVLFPGLRIGWIVAHREYIKNLIPLQRAVTISGNMLDQAALCRFCDQGHYELHLKRMHRVYRKRMEAALSALKKYVDPEKAVYSRPKGGYTIWLRLMEPGLTEKEAVRRFYENGLVLLPGSSHFIEPPDKVYFRLSIGQSDVSEITEGVKRLGMSL